MSETGAPLPKIVLFGSSITEWAFAECSPHFVENGFGTVLREKYAGKAVVLNRGRAGGTTASLLEYFNNIIHDLEAESERYTGWRSPLFFTIFLGANDACLPPAPTRVPLNEYEINIRYYVDMLLEHHVTQGTKIILITPPPINVQPPLLSQNRTLEEETLRAKEGRGYRTFTRKKRYAEKIKEIAASYGGNDRVACLDLWEPLMRYGREHGKKSKITPEGSEDDECAKFPGCGLPGARFFADNVFVDGLHFGTEGYKLVSEELLKLISSKWPEL